MVWCEFDACRRIFLSLQQKIAELFLTMTSPALFPFSPLLFYSAWAVIPLQGDLNFLLFLLVFLLSTISLCLFHLKPIIVPAPPSVEPSCCLANVWSSVFCSVTSDSSGRSECHSCSSNAASTNISTAVVLCSLAPLVRWSTERFFLISLTISGRFSLQPSKWCSITPAKRKG